MPRRVPIVLAQSPTSSPQRRGLEEQIVTRLLFESGMEVNVVEHLAHLEPGGTGLLCLEGLTGDFILLGWLERDEACRLLAAQQVTGRLGRTRFDPETLLETGPSQRTIYYLDLGRCESAEPVLAEVRRIRDDLALATVPLVGLTLPAPSGAPAAAPPPAPATPDPLPPAPPLPAPPAGTHSSPSLTDTDLDQLVDQLDELEL